MNIVTRKLIAKELYVNRWFIAGGAASGVISILIAATGNPLPAIMRAIETRRPDLLVLGTRGDGRMRRAVLGSVANQVLKLAPCDMLIVPQGTSEASTAHDADRTVLSSAPMSA